MIIIENEKNIVYLYGFSTRKRMYLDNFIEIICEQAENNASIAIVLLHDGVIGASKSGRMPILLDKLLNLSISVFALLPDILARGIKPNTIDPRIKCIEYSDLVDILTQTQKIASWM